MTPERFRNLTRNYRQLRIAVLGDFCLDRYLEIDPALKEISIETGLPVHNVVRVRSQPGGAGTILNNLVALGIGQIYPIGFAGEDGEGYELCRSLQRLAGVTLDHFIRTDQRRTFAYTKPLLIEPGKAPVELNRIDFKNWSPTPASLAEPLIESLDELAETVDAMIILDQVDEPETGAITTDVLAAVAEIVKRKSDLLILADSRRGLKNYPAVCLKMNRAELAVLTGCEPASELELLKRTSSLLARRHGHYVFVTLSEQGMIGASASGEVEHLPAFPVRGEIDVVGAGDAVSANLAASLAAGATLPETLEIAQAAASVVIHQLGTTGTATVGKIRETLFIAQP